MFTLVSLGVITYLFVFIFPFSGLGDSEYIHITGMYVVGLLEAFLRAGFASRGNTKYEVSPCPTGTFLNASSRFEKLRCLECPAGKSNDWFAISVHRDEA